METEKTPWGGGIGLDECLFSCSTDDDRLGWAALRSLHVDGDGQLATRRRVVCQSCGWSSERFGTSESVRNPCPRCYGSRLRSAAIKPETAPSRGSEGEK